MARIVGTVYLDGHACECGEPGTWRYPVPGLAKFITVCTNCLEFEREMRGGRDPQGLRPFRAQVAMVETYGVKARAAALLADGTPRTAKDIGAAIGANAINVRTVLRRNKRFKVVDTCWVAAGPGGKTERRTQLWAIVEAG